MSYVCSKGEWVRLIVSTIKEIFVKWWFSTSSVNTPSNITVENSLLWQTNTTCHNKLAEVLFLFLMRLVGWQIPQCWMTASTVSAASDQNNSQRAFKEKPLGDDGVHMERNTLSMTAQTDGSDRVINKTAGKTKIKGEGQPVCVHISQRPFVWAACCAHDPTAWPRCCCGSWAQESGPVRTSFAGSGPGNSAAPNGHTQSSSSHQIPESPSSQKPLNSTEW